MNRYRIAIALAAASVLALPLTACSGESSPQSSAEEDSPLNAYLSAAWGGDLSEEEQQAYWSEQNTKREEITAACMSDLGWEYVPNVDNTVTVSSGEEWQPDDREWVAQYGYGMINWPGQEETETEGTEEYTDPNQDYVMSLSESEQTAYYADLYGAGPTEEELNEDGSYEWNWETAGCSGKASHEVDGDSPWSDEQFVPLMEAISQLYTDAGNAPELSALNKEWADCMADAGYPGFAKQEDAQTSISDELNAYYENQTEWVEDDPELAELAETEVDLALADLDCREKTDFRAQQAKVQRTLEEQFIEDHKAELEAFKAAAEQGR
ncbi:hypothetical protein [Microbacterium sp.]|uniref:hypothetical protein n=1 Tax=Microbacterium sp. TaxID=51671 RepID=UPI0039E6C5D3